MVVHTKDWVARLPEAVWAYKTSWKNTIGFTPFEMLYEKTTMMPIKFEHKTLRTTLELDMDIFTPQKERVMQLNALDELRKLALQQTEVVQNKRSKWHDKYI